MTATARAVVLDVDKRLEGWKEIAAARNCDVRTAMRRYDRHVKRTKGRVWVMRSKLPVEVDIVAIGVLEDALARARHAVAELAKTVESLEAIVERATACQHRGDVEAITEWESFCDKDYRRVRCRSCGEEIRQERDRPWTSVRRTM